MKISKTSYSIEVTEDDLKEALEFYLKDQLGCVVEVSNIKHLVGERTEGYGGTEIDIPYQEGLLLTCNNKSETKSSKLTLKTWNG